MKYRIAAALVLLGCAASPPPPPSVAESGIDSVLDATVALVRADGRVYCSGSFYRDAVLTAAHCIADDATAILVASRLDFDADNTVRQSHAMTIAAIDRDYDIALLVGVVPTPHDSLVLANSPPGYGERIVLAGHPHRLVFSLTAGRVVHPRRVGDFLFGDRYVWIQSSVGTGPGSSGGPIVNGYGELVGVHSGTYGEFGVHVHLDTITALLRQSGLVHE